MLTFFENVYTIRILYKSGYAQDFECTYFKLANNVATWKGARGIGPIELGIDEIAAIWHISSRNRLKFKFVKGH